MHLADRHLDARVDGLARHGAADARDEAVDRGAVDGRGGRLVVAERPAGELPPCALRQAAVAAFLVGAADRLLEREVHPGALGREPERPPGRLHAERALRGLAEFALELGDGGVLRHPADVDACDGDPVGEAAGGLVVGPGERSAGGGEQHGEDGEDGGDAAAGHHDVIGRKSRFRYARRRNFIALTRHLTHTDIGI